MPGIFSEYCGPDLWIWQGTGIPRDAIDAICKKHDDAYERYKETYGYYPYANFIDADQEFLNDVKKHWKEKPIVAGPAIAWFEAKKVPTVLWNEFKARVLSHFNAVDDQVQNAFMKKPGLSTLPFSEFRKLVTRQGQKDTSVYNMPKSKRIKTEDDLGFPEIAPSPRMRERKQPVREMEVDANGETTAESRSTSPIMAGDHNAIVPNDFDWEGVTSRSAMSNTGDAPMPLARAAISAGTQTEGGQNGTGETQVDFGNPYERGFFTETRTALLPSTSYFSMARLDKTAPVVLKIRLNAPYNIFRDNTLTQQSQGSPWVKGLNNTLATNVNDATSPLLHYPSNVEGQTIGTGPIFARTQSSSGAPLVASAKPGWLPYYERVYESYHVIETFYRITLEAVGGNPQRSFTVFETDDVYTGNSVGNIIPTNQPYTYYQQWRNITTHALRYRDNNSLGSHKKVIEGVWRPQQINRNTVNDEDIKAWYPTNAEPSPNWVEQKVLLGFVGDMSELWGAAHINIRVDLVYKVQFKDLRRQFRYPGFYGADQLAAFNTDAIMPNSAAGPTPDA